MAQKCPQCGSSDVIEYKDEITFIICKSCGYDELQQGSVTGTSGPPSGKNAI